MPREKKWNAGVADETWKVIICGQDLYRIGDLLSALSYYLTDESDVEVGIAKIRHMSGDQIIDALEAHKRLSLLSVQNALPKRIIEPR